MRILAVDQGTTSTRAILFGPDGGVAPVFSHEHRQFTPAPGHVEHDPEELLDALSRAIAAAPDGVAAVGIANQGESCLAWDAATGRALTPVIVWQDDRTAADCARLSDAGAAAVVRARAGLPLDPYFSASKLAWFLRAVPAVRAAHAAGRLRLGTTDAFFRDRLTGRFETDVTTASRTALMNLATCGWDPVLCDLFGVPRETLPRITASAGDLGRIGPRGLPLAASLVDQQAALYGQGCHAPGAMKITFGTGAFALAVAGAAPPAPDGGAVPTVAWQVAGAPPVYAVEGGVYSAAAALNWARSVGLSPDLAVLDEIGDGPAGGPVFVPALNGLACPHWNRSARGAWLGLGQDTTAADLLRAVMEGVAFRMAEVVEVLAQGAPGAAGDAEPIRIDGGMTANGWFCQRLADTLGRAVAVADTPEMTARGTAMLAGLTHGVTLPEPAPARVLTPRPLPPGARTRFSAARAAVERFAAAGG
jgi:glycerol kinase